MFARLLPLVAALVARSRRALAGGPTMQFGAAEDVVRAPDLPSAKAKMTMLRLAGFSSVRVTSQWQGTEAAPSAGRDRDPPQRRRRGPALGVRVYLAVYPTGSRVTPLTPEARELFAAYVTALKQQLPSVKDVIVGNEPNLNRFWLPQFNPDGTDAAAPAYLALLARSYDAVKAVDPATRVWGGALAPRGIDRPGTGRDTHSPVAFLKDMGVAYRASGRTLPVMDGLAFHPYADTSGQSPDTPHPNSTTIGLADYDRLIRTLGDRLRRHARRPARPCPILYDEFGVESQIPAGQGARRTPAPSRRRRSRSTRSPRARTTSARSSSRSASRT